MILRIFFVWYAHEPCALSHTCTPRAQFAVGGVVYHGHGAPCAHTRSQHSGELRHSSKPRVSANPSTPPTRNGAGFAAGTAHKHPRKRPQEARDTVYTARARGRLGSLYVPRGSPTSSITADTSHTSGCRRALSRKPPKAPSLHRTADSLLVNSYSYNYSEGA